jgi:hypothetical protein
MFTIVKQKGCHWKMAKKLNILQTYFIDNNLGLTDAELVKNTGASLRQVKARRATVQGKNREGGLKGEPEERVINQPMPERQAELENQAQKAAATEANQSNTKLDAIAGRPAPAMRIDALIARKGGTTSLTGPAAELADMFDGIAPGSKPVVQQFDPFADESKVHRIKK